VVTRRLWSDTAAADGARQTLNFPGRRRRRRGATEERPAGAVATQQTRYLACSLDPGAVTPLALLALVRGHWGVENRRPFIKERWWDEDRH
jgi:hypothetical protein